MTVPMGDAVRIAMQGAIAMGHLVVACFFVKFWRESRQRLFLYFACGFIVLTIHRTMFALTFGDPAWDTIPITLRLIGYLTILAGIIDRRVSAPATPPV